MNDTERILRTMHLHQRVEIDNMIVTRVLGGWIYELPVNDAPVFVKDDVSLPTEEEMEKYLDGLEKENKGDLSPSYFNGWSDCYDWMTNYSKKAIR